MRTLLIVGLLAGSACSTAVNRATKSTAAQPVNPDPAAQEVVQATQRFFDAMAAHDTAALRRLLHPRALITGVGSRGPRVATGAEWIQDVAAPGEVLRERIWNPRVEVAGNIATLWAPYDFHLGEKFSHCGTDAFQFVRENGQWRLLAVTFTVQREGCAPGPKD